MFELTEDVVGLAIIGSGAVVATVLADRYANALVLLWKKFHRNLLQQVGPQPSFLRKLLTTSYPIAFLIAVCVKGMQVS
jgi:hypothetical protein